MLIPAAPADCNDENIPVAAPPYTADCIVAAAEPAATPAAPNPAALRTNGAPTTAVAAPIILHLCFSRKSFIFSSSDFVSLQTAKVFLIKLDRSKSTHQSIKL